MADLQRWTFAAFHTSLLVLLAVWLIHLSGALRDLLGGLDTLLGLGLYGVLWAVVWVATGRAFDDAPPGTSTPRERAKAGFVYGGFTGAGFVLIVLVGATLVFLVTGGELLFIAAFGVLGSVVAFVVGGLVGVAFGLLDAPLVRAGERLVPGDQ